MRPYRLLREFHQGGHRPTHPHTHLLGERVSVEGCRYPQVRGGVAAGTGLLPDGLMVNRTAVRQPLTGDADVLTEDFPLLVHMVVNVGVLKDVLDAAQLHKHGVHGASRTIGHGVALAVRPRSLERRRKLRPPPGHRLADGHVLVRLRPDTVASLVGCVADNLVYVSAWERRPLTLHWAVVQGDDVVSEVGVGHFLSRPSDPYVTSHQPDEVVGSLEHGDKLHDPVIRAVLPPESRQAPVLHVVTPFPGLALRLSPYASSPSSSPVSPET